MSSRITVRLSNKKAFCTNLNCPFHNTCANSITASSKRHKEGFTPDLFEEGGRFFCRTQKTDSAEPLGGSFSSSIITVGLVDYIPKEGEIIHPRGYEEMPKGLLYYEKRKEVLKYGAIEENVNIGYFYKAKGKEDGC